MAEAQVMEVIDVLVSLRAVSGEMAPSWSLGVVHFCRRSEEKFCRLLIVVQLDGRQGVDVRRWQRGYRNAYGPPAKPWVWAANNSDR